MGYAIRITTRAVEVVSGADQTPGIVAAESSGVKVGFRGKWGGTELRSRPGGGKLVPQGSGWVMEGGGGSPYSGYNNTASGAPSPGLPPSPSPYVTSARSAPSTPLPGSVGLGYPSGSFGPAPLPGGIRASTSLGPPPRTVSGTRTSLGSTYSPLAPRSSTPDPNDPIVVSNMHPSASHNAYPTLFKSPNEDESQIAPPPLSRKVVPKKDD